MGCTASAVSFLLSSHKLLPLLLPTHPRPEEVEGGSDAAEVSWSLYSGGRTQTPKMAAASEERMAEEGGGSHGDGGSCSASGSAQRQPPPTPSQAPQPGSQAPAAPALAPDHLPQNNTLVALPIVAIENILSFMSYDEISQLRLVSLPDPRGTPATLGRRGTRSAPPPAAGQCPRCRPTGRLLLLLHRHPESRAGEAPRLWGSLRPQPGTRPPARSNGVEAWCPPPGGAGIPEGAGGLPRLPSPSPAPGFSGAHSPSRQRIPARLGLCCKTSVLFLQPPKLPG